MLLALILRSAFAVILAVGWEGGQAAQWSRLVLERCGLTVLRDSDRFGSMPLGDDSAQTLVGERSFPARVIPPWVLVGSLRTRYSSGLDRGSQWEWEAGTLTVKSPVPTSDCFAITY